MAKMDRLLNDLHTDESGQGLVEYVLVIALIALGSVATMSSAASSIAQAFNKLNNKLISAVP